MSWIGVLTALLGIIGDIAVFLKERKLIEAAQAEIIAQGARDTIARTAKAAAAVKALKTDPTSVADDPNNRDRKPPGA